MLVFHHLGVLVISTSELLPGYSVRISKMTNCFPISIKMFFKKTQKTNVTVAPYVYVCADKIVTTKWMSLAGHSCREDACGTSCWEILKSENHRTCIKLASFSCDTGVLLQPETLVCFGMTYPNVSIDVFGIFTSHIACFKLYKHFIFFFGNAFHTCCRGITHWFNPFSDNVFVLTWNHSQSEPTPLTTAGHWHNFKVSGE